MLLGVFSEQGSAAPPVISTTFDPTGKHPGLTLLSANREVYQSLTYNFPLPVRFNTGQTAGKRQCQFTMTAAGACHFGFVNASYDFSKFGAPGLNGEGGSLNSTNGISWEGRYVYYGNAVIADTGVHSIPTASIVDLLVDIDNDLWWVALNGTPVAGNPVAGTGGFPLHKSGIMYPIAAPAKANVAHVTMNAGNEAFANSYAGFVPWG